MDNRTFFATRLDAEHALSRKVVAAVLDAGLDHKPDEKSRTAEQLLGHMIGHYQDLVELLDDAVIHHRMQVPFENVADACEKFDRACEELRARVAAADDGRWQRPAQFWVGDFKTGEAPTSAYMWTLLFDMIHHRGQLSTYLRPMGSKVPSIYGPSADEPPGS